MQAFLVSSCLKCCSPCAAFKENGDHFFSTQFSLTAVVLALTDQKPAIVTPLVVNKYL